MGETSQYLQASANCVVRGAQPFVRQRLPRRELDDGVCRQETPQFNGEVFGFAGGGGHRNNHAVAVFGVRKQRTQHRCQRAWSNNLVLTSGGLCEFNRLCQLRITRKNRQ